jgi:hypothetical protein
LEHAGSTTAPNNHDKGMSMSTLAGGGLYLAFVIFSFVLGIVWIVLPFAIFGIKGRLDRIIEAQARTNAELSELRAAIGRQGGAAAASGASGGPTLGEIMAERR